MTINKNKCIMFRQSGTWIVIREFSLLEKLCHEFLWKLRSVKLGLLCTDSSDYQLGDGVTVLPSLTVDILAQKLAIKSSRQTRWIHSTNDKFSDRNDTNRLENIGSSHSGANTEIRLNKGKMDKCESYFERYGMCQPNRMSEVRESDEEIVDSS